MTVLRRRKGEAERVSYPCPSAFMGGVNKHDRMTLTNEVDRRSKFRFYLRLGFNFLDQAMVNSKIAWETIPPTKKYHQNITVWLFLEV